MSAAEFDAMAHHPISHPHDSHTSFEQRLGHAIDSGEIDVIVETARRFPRRTAEHPGVSRLVRLGNNPPLQRGLLYSLGNLHPKAGEAEALGMEVWPMRMAQEANSPPPLPRHKPTTTSGIGDEVDIDATIEHALELGYVRPIMRTWLRERADLLVVLDASSSMEGYKWSLAVATTLALRAWLNNFYRFRIILFSGQPVEITVSADTATAWRKLMQVRRTGVTNIAAAAGYAVELASSTSWVVFVTDGRANVGRSHLDVAGQAERMDVVLVGDEPVSSVRTDGVVVTVRDPGEVKNIFERLAV